MLASAATSFACCQAKSALLFLYREVLHVELPWLDEVIAAKMGKRLPVVLTPTEIRRLLNGMSGTMGLLAALLYGTGMRLLEGLRLMKLLAIRLGCQKRQPSRWLCG